MFEKSIDFTTHDYLEIFECNGKSVHVSQLLRNLLISIVSTIIITHAKIIYFLFSFSHFNINDTIKMNNFARKIIIITHVI